MKISKKIPAVLTALALSVVSFSACEKKYVELDDMVIYNFNTPADGEEIAVFHISSDKTDYGEVRIKLFPEQVPNSVKNFKALVEKGYYDGLLFFRCESYVIQSGDPNNNGSGGETADGNELVSETVNGLCNFVGAVGYAAKPGSIYNASQFYILTGDSVDENRFLELASYGDNSLYFAKNVKQAYYQHGGIPSFDNTYTVFGQVFEEDIEKCISISKTETDNGNKPVSDIVITKAEIKKYSAD